MAIISTSGFKVVVGGLFAAGLLGALVFALKGRSQAQPLAAPEDWPAVQQRWAAVSFGEYHLRVELAGAGKTGPVFQANGAWDAPGQRARETVVLPDGKAEAVALEGGSLFGLDVAHKQALEIVMPPAPTDRIDSPTLRCLRRCDLSAMQRLTLDPMNTSPFGPFPAPQSSERQGESDVYHWQAQDGSPPSYVFRLWVRPTDGLPTKFVCEYPFSGRSVVYTYDIRPLTAAPILPPIPTSGLKRLTVRPTDPMAWETAYRQTSYCQTLTSLEETLMRKTAQPPSQDGGGKMGEGNDPVTGEYDGWAADSRTRRMSSLAELRRRSIIPVLTLPTKWGKPTLIQQQVPAKLPADDELDSMRFVFTNAGNGQRWSVEADKDSWPPAGGATQEVIKQNAGSEKVETIHGRQVALSDSLGRAYLYATWYEPHAQEQVNITMAGTDTKRLRRLATELIAANLTPNGASGHPGKTP
jgi:hypothetical protein